MKKIYKCIECGKTFTIDDCELPEPRTINDDTEQERIICDTCFDNMWDKRFVFYCLPGSSAQQYARKNDIPIKPLHEFKNDIQEEN